MKMRDAIQHGLTAAVFALLAQHSGAQSVSNVTVAVQGDDVVASVLFSGTVRVIQQSPEAPSKFVQIQIELLVPDNGVPRDTTSGIKSEPAPGFRRVPATGSASEFTLETNFAAPKTPATKSGIGSELVTTMNLRLGEDTVVRARQGANPKTIDLVLVGKGVVGLNPAAQAIADAQSSKGAPQAGATEPSPVLATPEVETRAAQLMALAREAVVQRNTQTAIGQLNQLLLLPPNSLTQDAQEMIGLAWERSGDLGRAKMEYELYLKLFPVGEGAQRVAQRMVSMDPAPAAKAATPVESAKAGPIKPTIKFSGNLSEYYFGGKSRSQSLVTLVNGIDQSTLSKNTESALVTNLDLGARYATDESDIRAVLRGTGSANLSSTSNNRSILNAAFVDYRVKSNGLAVRVGRQSPINGGLLGMFDGLSLTYPVKPGVRVNLMGGVPASPLVSSPNEQMYAAMVEADSIFLQNLSGDMYILNQTTQGITNRRTIGTEARYSNERGSLYALVDYDQLFSAINAVSLQGSIQGPAQTTVTLLLDRRKAPSLQLTNALISNAATSLKELLQRKQLSEIMSDASDITAQADQAMLSVSRPISEKWQLTGDVQYSAIGALPAVPNFEATPATGAQYGLSMQLTGSNLYSKRDINNFNMSVLSTPLFRGLQLAYNNLTGFDDNKFTLEPSMRLYTQNDNQGVSMRRFSPGLRASYNVSKKISVSGEGMFEHSTNDGPTNTASTNSVFFYVGARYELF
jgi:hypothetical protein